MRTGLKVLKVTQKDGGQEPRLLTASRSLTGGIRPLRCFSLSVYRPTSGLLMLPIEALQKHQPQPFQSI